MRLLIAPDKFKGTLTAREAAHAMAAGARAARPEATIDLCPMSDGGDGFVDVLAEPMGATRVTRTVTGPLPEMRVEATFAVAPHRDLAIIELAAASGLALLADDERDPWRATTYGTGELIRHAVAMDCRRVLLGLGGSATVDGGLGMLQAMGYPITLGDRAEPDDPLTAADLPRVVAVRRAGPCDGLELRAACDVTTPATDAAATFGPQKGVAADEVRELTACHRHLARVLACPDTRPHTGAAGAAGLAVGAIGGRLEPGVEVVADALGLARRVAAADLVLTGEGAFDATSLAGKVVGHVLSLAGDRVRVIVGRDDSGDTPNVHPLDGRDLADVTARVTAA